MKNVICTLIALTLSACSTTWSPEMEGRIARSGIYAGNVVTLTNSLIDRNGHPGVSSTLSSVRCGWANISNQQVWLCN